MNNINTLYKMFEFLKKKKGNAIPIGIKALVGTASDEDLFNHKVALVDIFVDALAYDKLEYLLTLMPESMMTYVTEQIVYNGGYSNYKLIQLLINKDKKAFLNYAYLSDEKIIKIINLPDLNCFKLWVKYGSSFIFEKFIYAVIDYYDENTSPYDKSEQDQSNAHLKYIFEESNRKISKSQFNKFLLDVLHQKNIQLAQYLIEQGADVNYISYDENQRPSTLYPTILYYAERISPNALKMLLEKGVKVEYIKAYLNDYIQSNYHEERKKHIIPILVDYIKSK